eukprot:6213989-Pleurochrysis_carterae.AAC.2
MLKEGATVATIALIRRNASSHFSHLGAGACSGSWVIQRITGWRQSGSSWQRLSAPGLVGLL